MSHRTVTDVNRGAVTPPFHYSDIMPTTTKNSDEAATGCIFSIGMICVLVGLVQLDWIPSGMAWLVVGVLFVVGALVKIFKGLDEDEDEDDDEDDPDDEPDPGREEPIPKVEVTEEPVAHNRVRGHFISDN